MEKANGEFPELSDSEACLGRRSPAMRHTFSHWLHSINNNGGDNIPGEGFGKECEHTLSVLHISILLTNDHARVQVPDIHRFINHPFAAH
jgi:hypothetical protein